MPEEIPLPGGLPKPVVDFLAAIEQSPVGLWVREDFYAFFYIIMVHAFGMALLVGGGAAVFIGMMAAPEKVVPKFRGFFPVMWVGLGLAVVSGVLLLAGYPAKALTNWDFYLKLSLFAAAGALTWWMARTLFPKVERGEDLPEWRRWAGAAGLLLWAGGVVAGKMLLYTYWLLTVS
jgi:hypothetical protein